MMADMRFFDRPLPQFPLSSVSDYRRMAEKRLPKLLFDFLEGGAFEEVTLGKNSADFQRICLKRRILKDVSHIETSVELFGQKLAFPLILAPVGFAGAYARRGEVQAAKAAAKANIPFSLSTVSICAIEEMPAPFWFQFYLFKDRAKSLELLERAAHCPVLLLTADLPVAGMRYRYDRTRKSSRMAHFFDSLAHLPWWVDVRLRGKPLTLGNMPQSAPSLPNLAAMRQWMGSQINLSFTWKDLEWVQKHWKGKIVIKGVLDQEDALLAAKAGADGIVVSNHGARHLDSTPSTIAALPAIRDAVEDKINVLIDGGIASGLDIVKALALGADACLIGKPWVYGLAARGEVGVSEVISLLRKELITTMTHLGVTSIPEIDRSLWITNC